MLMVVSNSNFIAIWGYLLTGSFDLGGNTQIISNYLFILPQYPQKFLFNEINVVIDLVVQFSGVCHLRQGFGEQSSLSLPTLFLRTG